MSDLEDSCIKGDDSCGVKILITYCLMLHNIYVTMIMRLWDLYNLVAILVEFDMDSLLLFPPQFWRCFRLVIIQSVGSCRVDLIPEVGVIFCCLLPKVISDLLCTLYNFMHCPLILPLICRYTRYLASKTHIWCISGFVLKIGYYR